MGISATGVPVMGYSMVPVPNGLTMMGLPQASGSLSQESLGYLIPEMAFTPPGSISRSCSPLMEISGDATRNFARTPPINHLEWIPRLRHRHDLQERTCRKL